MFDVGVVLYEGSCVVEFERGVEKSLTRTETLGTVESLSCLGSGRSNIVGFNATAIKCH
jgi:hypothetical protein